MHERHNLARDAAKRSGFTTVETLVLAGVVCVLIAIFLPYVYKVREMSRRTECGDNLRQLGLALNNYAKDNQGAYPCAAADPLMKGYTAFTGAGAASAFDRAGGMGANDVTASLWLLVSHGYIGRLSTAYAPATSIFICPSSGQSADPAGPGQRANFGSFDALSYSYCSPFGTNGFRLTDHLSNGKGFALVADRNPGVFATGGPSPGAAPFDMAKGNSRNHRGAGQNVLDATGVVSFYATPYCGIDNDNIYSAQADADGQITPPSGRGASGPAFGPMRPTDSYLVPADGDAFPAATPATAPATAPSTAPATTRTTNPTTPPDFHP